MKPFIGKFRNYHCIRCMNKKEDVLVVEPVLQVKNVKKKIGSRMIIDDLSMDVYPGEIMGLLGPNGSGKTTTIRMIVGLMSITEGDIFIKGKSITDHFEEAIAHVGGIVENPEMYKYLSGYKNLLHYARMGQNIPRERIDEVVKLVGLEKRIHDKVGRYSLGMRQRLGLAQALLHSPSLLILDEPTNGLDPAGIREFRDHLRTLAREQGVAVLISSHLLSEMELICDRITIIQDGKLVGVQRVNDFVAIENNNEKVSVHFTVEPVEEGVDLLKKRYPKEMFRTEGQRITVTMVREEIPDAVACLVHENIKVYGVEVETRTLEDKFLEVTGGNQIV